ncbi:hypothetical protein ABFS83_06G156300 [Erythranthe nasuta]
MAGNARYEMTSASPDSGFAGNSQNGQRGYSAATLDRSTSFREGTDSKNFTSGKANSRGSASSSGDVTALTQCLMLDPVALCDLKHPRSNELKRLLGFSVGSGSEENSFSAAHLKNTSPVAVEELKRLRASVADTCVKASGRAKKLDDHLSKLNKFVESVSSKKQQQRNEILTNERSSGSNLKSGSLMHRNPSEFGNQKFDDRPKNGGVNKRLRTSVAETRAECRNNGVLRQSLMVTKERDLLKDVSADSDIVEEKIRRLPAGGEGWDKKMKRKRSVGAVFSRSVDNDGELKRTMHNKLTNESSLQSSDSNLSFRSGASGGSNKLDATSSPAGSNARTTLKNEQEKSTLSRDLSAGPIKEKILGKLNVRINNREDNNAVCPSQILKGKASRAPRSGSIVTANSPSNTLRVSGTLESWEQPQSVNRTPTNGGPTNRKRPAPAGASSPPITQWGGQRPQKMSRTRRTNLIPVSNLDDTQLQPEGCSPSDFGPRASSFSVKSSANGNQNSNVKAENVSSPARFSESEESGAGDIRIREKGLGSEDVEERDASTGQNASSAIPTKKNKVMLKEEIGDGVRRQGRSGRVSPFSRSSISPNGEKLDNAGPIKPPRNARSGSDKNGSRSGRPLKKLSDRKGFSRLGHMANGGSPDCSGESEDDHEELLVAANLAWNSSTTACTSAFWKSVDSLFASIGSDDKSYLSEQLKLSEECPSTYQNSSDGNNLRVKLDDYGHEEIAASDPTSFGRYRQMNNVTRFKNSSDRMDYVEQIQDSPEAEKIYDKVTPLYQRVLSALILEEETEEFEETGCGRPRSLVNDSYLREPILGVQTQRNCNADIIVSCNGNGDFDRYPSAQDYLFNDDRMQIDGGYVHSEVEVLVRLSRCDYVVQSLQTNNCGISPIDCQYEQMRVEEKLVLELQSIGLFVEAVPALDDKEDELINDEIVQLERELQEQIEKKKSSLNKIDKDIQEGKEIVRRDTEQVAMDKLVELAYKKFLATRGSFASKHGVAKVSKQVALSFAKRTLSRCHKFEDSGASCFSEPALRDIIFASPPRFDETKPLTGATVAVTNADAFDQDFARNGPISNRAKRKELLLDDVGGAVFRASSALGISDGTKGKRSERDSTRNMVVKTGRPLMGGAKGERKAKSKPKQRTAQLSTSANGLVNKFTDNSTIELENTNNKDTRKKDVRFMSCNNNVPPVPSKETKESIMEFNNLPLNGIEGIEELVVDTEIDGTQDLNSWLDLDGLQDHDSAGLEIPMDDLAELNMF